MLIFHFNEFRRLSRILLVATQSNLARRMQILERDKLNVETGYKTARLNHVNVWKILSAQNRFASRMCFDRLMISRLIGFICYLRLINCSKHAENRCTR